MSVVEEEQTSKICCLRSTSTGTRRVVRPSGWGVANSLARRGCGPVVLVHTQNLRFFYKEKPTCGFGECPLWMEERTLSISGSRSALDPERTFVEHDAGSQFLLRISVGIRASRLRRGWLRRGQRRSRRHDLSFSWYGLQRAACRPIPKIVCTGLVALGKR
jgi:hypothetical protein